MTPAPSAPGEADPEAAPGADADHDRRLKPERRQGDRRQSELPVTVDRRAGERRQVQRRAPRNINAYELGPEELEFIQAIHTHKQRTGRAFPTWSEVLRILRELGYEKTR